jgi:OOP family OmpA-OmpF porin
MGKKGMAVMIFVATAFFLGGLAPQSQALEAVVATKVVKKIDKIETLVRIADNVIILFDSSGSMGDPFGDSGMSKLAAAKTILKQRANLLPATYPELKVGLYSYTPSNKGESKTVLYDLKPFNKAEFLTSVDELPKEASGPTLMVNAMRKLGKGLEGLTGHTVVFLFTDGTHSDQGATDSPLTLARKIASKHDVNFQVISTTDDKTKVALMEAVASLNEKSRVQPFEDMIERPEIFTGAVFALEETFVVSAETQKEVIGFKLDNIKFGFDKANVEIEFDAELDTVGQVLQTNPNSYVVLAGHTDNVGSEDYNLALSHKRVEAVANYLSEKFKIDSSRIETFWYGSAAPVASNDTEAGRKKNRRVVGFIAGVN